MLRFLRLAGQAGARVSLALACRAQIAEFNGKVIGGNDGGDKAKSAVVENDLSPEWMETHIFLVGHSNVTTPTIAALHLHTSTPTAQLDKQVDRFKIRVKDEGVAGGKEIVRAGCAALPPCACLKRQTSTTHFQPHLPRLQGTATIMLDTEHQEAKEYPLDTQGTVTIAFKVTDLGDVMP